MGRADSALRDKVIFVDGAPRSGTTWLVTLLASHPEIAGVSAESHLFDLGVDRLFDNFEGRDPSLRGLQSYVEREQLVDLARDLCDGVLAAMRAHVSGATSSQYVVEKTPVGARSDGRDLERKRECYPDAWFLHIVRERDAVVRSLMRAPFMADRSRDACGGLWDRVVGDIRHVLADAPRYRELPYERLAADPLAACLEVFEWLGLETDEQARQAIQAVSRERVSEMGVAPEPPPTTRVLLRDRARSAVRRVLSGRQSVAEADDMSFRFVAAMRNRDPEALQQLLHDPFELVIRAPGGDRWIEGQAASETLVAAAVQLFEGKYISEWWASSGGGPGEWWTTTPGKPFHSIFCSALGGDATRTDVVFGLMIDDHKVRRLVIVTAGPLTGRSVAAGPADAG